MNSKILESSCKIAKSCTIKDYILKLSFLGCITQP